jgi:hypothetical protein
MGFSFVILLLVLYSIRLRQVVPSAPSSNSIPFFTKMALISSALVQFRSALALCYLTLDTHILQDRQNQRGIRLLVLVS